MIPVKAENGASWAKVAILAMLAMLAMLARHSKSSAPCGQQGNSRVWPSPLRHVQTGDDRAAAGPNVLVDHQTLLQLTAAMRDAPTPIYRWIKQAIVYQIRAGHWQPHQPVPSESELVAELGVSHMTINRALRELTSEAS